MSNYSNWLGRFNLNHLPVFVAIVETGNITKAARLVGAEKTRASRMLSELESDLGVKLLLRTTRHLRLTAQGEIFYRHCKSVLQEIDEATKGVARLEGEVAGHIRMTGAHGLVSLMLPEIIQEFSRRYPKVTFDILLTQEYVNLVREGVDLALRIGKLEDSSQKARKIGECRFVIVASPAFLKKIGHPIEFANLSSHPAIIFPHYADKLIEISKPGQVKKIRLKSAITCNSPDLILSLILKGLGLGVLPELMCRDHLKTGQLVRLLDPWSPMPVTLSVLFHAFDKKRPHIDLFIKFLVSTIERQLH